MANSDKNILITPNVGQTAEPRIVFTGSGNTPVTLRVLDSNALSFEGSAGQLFSITNSLTGTLFSVNDISGIPSIEVNDAGLVKLAQYNGSVAIGSAAALQSGGVNAELSITNSAATTPGLIIKAATSQTANLTEWQDSAGSILTRVSSNGSVIINQSFAVIGGSSVSGSTAALFQTQNAARTAVTIQGFTAQTADLQQWQNSAGTNLVQVGSDGTLRAASFAANATGKAYLFPNGDTGGFILYTNNAANKGIVLRASASQTANLQEWQDSGGSVLSRMDAFGRLALRTGVLGTSVFSVLADTATSTPITVRGAASQTAALQQWQNSAGTVLSQVRSDGAFINPTGGYITFMGNATSQETSLVLGSNRNIYFGSFDVSYGGGAGVLGIRNATTVPTSNPTGGGVLYAEGGALNWIGTSGSAKTIVNGDGTTPFVERSTVTTKGDLLAATASSTITRLPIGATNGHVLTVDSAETTGMKWAAAGASSESAIISDTAPISATNGQFWFDSSTGNAYIYYDSSWVEISAGATGPQGPAGPTVTQSSGGFYGVPGMIPSSVTTSTALAASTIYYMPFLVQGTIYVSEVGGRVAGAATAGAKNRIAIYKATSAWLPGDLVADLGEISVDSTGFKSIAGLDLVLTPGSYHMRLHTDASATPPSFQNHRGPLVSGFIAQSNGEQYYFTQQATRTYGVAENPGQSVAVGAPSSATTSIPGMFYYLKMKWGI